MVFRCIARVPSLAGLICTLAAVSPADAPPPAVLTNAADIKQLSTAEAAREIPVRLHGVITAGPGTHGPVKGGGAFLADQTGAVYLGATHPLFADRKPGDEVWIEGVTSAGEFAPMVHTYKSTFTGVAPLPEPRIASLRELASGGLDAQFVQVEGIVRRVWSSDGERQWKWRAQIAVDGGNIAVLLSGADPTLQVTTDARVRVKGVCAYEVTGQRQVVRPLLLAQYPARLEILDPAPEDPHLSPARPISSLLRDSPDMNLGHRVRVEGRVTHYRDHNILWIRGDSGALRVQLIERQEVESNRPKIGERLSVLGFLLLDAYDVGLEDAEYKRLGWAPPPTPIPVSSPNDVFEHWNDLVTINGRLIEIRRALNEWNLTLEAEGTRFTARIARNGPEEVSPSLRPGSVVSVTGICSVLLDESVAYWTGIWEPQGLHSFLIEAGSLDNVQVLVAAPWWTAGRIIVLMAGIIVSLVLLTMAILFFTRLKQREQQQERQRAEVEFTAILNERNRAAREMHDILAQGLTATSVQLRLARKQTGNGGEALLSHLDSAQTLVRSSLEEARRAIWAMRSQALEQSDLSGALQQLLKQMVAGHDIRAEFQCLGTQRRLAPLIENDLLHFGQEGITNAVRHAQASRIDVVLEFSRREVRLTVKDNGRGFDPAKQQSGRRGLGLVGMRERASEVKAEMTIQARPNQGTEITMTVPTTF